MQSKKNRPKVAVIQHPPVFLNLTASLDCAVTLVKKAAQNGADLVVFPETWLPGYPVWLDVAPNAAIWDHPPAKELFRILTDNSLCIPSSEMDVLISTAKEHRVVVVMGAHEKEGSTLYNTMLFIDETGEFEIHRKLMPTYSERLIWGRGDGSTLSKLETELGTVGGLICWEHWMPLACAAMHAKKETIHIAQWPMVKEMNFVASRHYAFEGQCFVVAAGCVASKSELLDGVKSVAGDLTPAAELLQEIPGRKSDLILQGGSAIIAPNGDCLAGPLYDKAEILYAELPLEMISEGHLFLDTDGHYARPDVFELKVNTRPQVSVSFDAGEIDEG